MIKLYLDAVSVATPGMPTWQVAKSILATKEKLVPCPLDRYKPALLPPNERRRATNLIRLAFRVCEDLFESNPEQSKDLLSVFASSGGDYQIIDQICRTLCEEERILSPTQFHNSVHNSAAGYWSIAAHSTAASTSLSCHDFTFAAGLLEAATMGCEASKPVLLVVYDIDLPEPLLNKRYVAFPFAAAFILAPDKSESSITSISISQIDQQAPTKCQSAELETIRTGNPAARALPLLELISRKKSGTLVIDAPGNSSLQLAIEN